MSSRSEIPTSIRSIKIGGIKRLAKAIGREQSVPHHVALDMAAATAGYQNLRHAKSKLVHAEPALETFSVFLTAYWREPGKGTAAGRETLKISLAKALDQVIGPREVNVPRQMFNFRIESADHVERRTDLYSQDEARKELYAAERTLHFLAATNLRPLMTKRERNQIEAYMRMPNCDHPSFWIDRGGLGIVCLNEPYVSEPDKFEAWCNAEGKVAIDTQWSGLYSPKHAYPFLCCENLDLATRLSDQLDTLPIAPGDAPFWGGESARYWNHFVSPARAASQVPRKKRTMPAPRGFEKNGALPWGARAGEPSLWRPAIRMPVSLHMAAGRLLFSVCEGRIPKRVDNLVTSVRSLLDDWVQMEYTSQAEMTHEQFTSAYYGGWVDPIVEPTKQAEAIRQVMAILEDGYAPCNPRRDVLKKLDRAAEFLTKSV